MMHLFDKHVLAEAGLADLSPARRDKLCQRMDQLLKLRVSEALLDAISSDSLREVGVLLQEGALVEARQCFDDLIKRSAGVIGQEQERIKLSLRESTCKRTRQRSVC